MAFISIVVPVYYNEQSLPLLLERLQSIAASQTGHTFEFIFVDDGSGDHSFSVLQQLARQDARVRALRLSRNFGSNAAILAGLTYARGDCAAFLAADLQDPPETLPAMIQAWEQDAQVVLAVRRGGRGDPLLTRFFAAIFNWLFKVLVFNDMSPHGIGFFLIDRQVVNVLIQCSEKNSHIMALILWTGFKRAVIEYDRAERLHGKSRWTFGKKVKYFIDAFAAFSYVPLRISSLVGILFSIVGGIYALIVLIERLVGNIPVQGFAALMVVVLVTAGVQLLILGILGEYLWRTLDATRHRPPFIVAQVVEKEQKSEK